MAVDVSVYIPTYNSERYIERCIQGVLNQTYPIKEVVIVDDGSRDKTVEIASKYQVRIVRHSKNIGLASARNTAFDVIDSEFISSVDSDCVPHKDWLKILMSNFTDEKIAGVGGRVVEFHTKSLPDKWRKTHLSQDRGERKIYDVSELAGANTVFRKLAVINIGKYDEKYKTNNEDNDISHRLRKKGYVLVYDPEAVVFHMRKDTLYSVARMYWRWGNPVMPQLKPIHNFLKRIYWHVIRNLRHIKSDILSKRFDLLIVTIMTLFCCFWFDILALIRNEEI